MNELLESSVDRSQLNNSTNPSSTFGEVIDLHPLFAATAQAREEAETNGTPPKSVDWDPAWPELEVDDDTHWNDLIKRNWAKLSRWHSMSLWAEPKGQRLHFKVADGVETVSAIDVASGRATKPAIYTPVVNAPVEATPNATALGAHVRSPSDQWEKNGCPSDIPTKLDVSKEPTPPEPDDYYAEYGASAKVDGRIDFAAVKDATLRSLDFIIPLLVPGGKRQGDEWVARNPTRNDAKPGSFSINMRTGVWGDFATGEMGGDMIDLYTFINGGSNVQAKNALAEMLNVQARSGSTRNAPATPSARSAVFTAAPSDLREHPRGQ
jgi:hypothetical protein